jgi:hypothetical protein
MTMIVSLSDNDHLAMSNIEQALNKKLPPYSDGSFNYTLSIANYPISSIPLSSFLVSVVSFARSSLLETNILSNLR